MQHLFTPDGESALAVTMRRKPLLAFDFDGTLAPIVPRPEDARLSQAVTARLARLSTLLPLAIVTGRAVEDVRGRLGFEPGFIVGSHGAQDELDPKAAADLARALDPLREQLRARAPELAGLGVNVEDKGQSVALHYRLSRQRAAAQALIADILSPFDGPMHTFAGKQVVNVTAAGAPDKADAVRTLVARSGADSAVFAGDDINDEPVFASAPSTWLTVRVGRDDRESRAQFFLDSPNEMAMLLERMLVLLQA